MFLLNGFIFTAIGLQLPGILRSLGGQSLRSLVEETLLVNAAVVLVRIAWVFPGAYLPFLLNKKVPRREPLPEWQNVAIIAWSGMRGVVSLAAAFSLPYVLPDGGEFPGRNYILFLTFSVILVTLVFQGLTLPIVIRRLCIRADDSTDEEERTARLKANEAAIGLIENLRAKGDFSTDTVDRLRAEYDERVEQLQLCAGNPDDCRGEIATPQYQRLQREALDAERQTIIRLRNERVINDNALRHIQRDLDLAEARLTGN